uniref:Transposase n=1 Tax=Mesocestoides corti TaxID=53468 RepID=A0A5K3EVF9_MESCO
MNTNMTTVSSITSALNDFTESTIRSRLFDKNAYAKNSTLLVVDPFKYTRNERKGVK